MAQRFEDLDVWKRSFELAAEVYESFKNCRDFGLKDQVEGLRVRDSEGKRRSML